MNIETELEFLRKQALLEGLSDQQIRSLLENSVEEKFLPNQLVFEEGTLATEIYIILEGQVSLLKWDEEHSTEIMIGKLGKGETFGEMSFMDASPRSTTVKAAKPLTLLKFSKEKLTAFDDILAQIYGNIAIINIKRVRNSNILYVKNLQELQWLNKTQKNIGSFTLYEYLVLGLSFGLSIHLFPEDFQLFPEDFQSIVPWFISLVFSFILIRVYGFDFSHFGLNFKNLLPIILSSIIVLLSVIGLDWAVIYLSSTHHGFLQSFNALTDQRIASPAQWLILAIYSFSIEFVARGVLQTGLQDFFNDVKGYRSVFINTAFLFINILPFGPEKAIEFALIGIPMGFLYLKQKNIMGVFLIHYILLLLGIFKF